MIPRNFFVFAGAFILIMLTVGGGFFVWDRYFSEVARIGREQAAQLKLYQEKEAAYIEAMTADTYGGKIPQETLDLFVAALRAGDVELASKYFLLDENLSREKWSDLLKDIKERNYLEKLAEDISTKSVAGNLSSQKEFGYLLYNSDGTVGLQLDMRFNKYSSVWKIESL